jgi:hypothetical protein
MEDLDREKAKWASEQILDDSSTVIGILNSIKNKSETECISGSGGVYIGVKLVECINILEQIQENID